MTALDQKTFVALGKAQAARNGYTARAVVRAVHHRRRPDRLAVRDLPDLHLHLRALPHREADGLGRPLPRRLEDRRPDGSQPRRDPPPDQALGVPVRGARRGRRRGPTAGRCSTTSRSTAAGRATPTAPTPPMRACGRSRTRPPRAPTAPSSSTTTYSGSKALVTGGPAGSSANTYDLDGGTTTMRSRPIRLPSSASSYGPLTFRYYLAHGSNSSDRRLAAGDRRGARTGRRPSCSRSGARPTTTTPRGRSRTRSLADWAGQTIRIVVEATDGARRQPRRGGRRRLPDPPALARSVAARLERPAAPPSRRRRGRSPIVSPHARADRPRHRAGVGRGRRLAAPIGDRPGTRHVAAPIARPDADRSQCRARVARRVRRAVRARPRRRHGRHRPARSRAGSSAPGGRSIPSSDSSRGPASRRRAA